MGGERRGVAGVPAALPGITKISLLLPLYAKKRRGVWGNPRPEAEKDRLSAAHRRASRASFVWKEGSNVAARSINLLLSASNDSRDIVKFNLSASARVVDYSVPPPSSTSE